MYKGLLLVLSLIISISGLTQTGGMFKPKFQAAILSTPKFELVGIKTIAVLDFNSATTSDSEGGSKISDYITKVLLNEKRNYNNDYTHFTGGTTKIFDVMDRSSIKELISKDPSLSGQIGENTAVQIGKILNVDAVIIGSCSYTSNDETSVSSYTTDKGKTLYTYYRTRKLTAEARMNVIRVNDGEFVASDNSSQTVEDVASSSVRYPGVNDVKSPQALALSGYSSISTVLANSISPQYLYRTYELKNIKIKEYKQRAKDAKEQLKLNNIDPAYQLYFAIYSKDNYNPRAAYNLALMYEVGGEFAKAKEFYEIAHQLDPKEKLYDAGLVRITVGEQLEDVFERLNTPIVPHSFSTGDAAVLLREKVRVKGKRSVRVKVYDRPYVSAKVVQEVPGGVEFSVISKTDKWVLVDLKIGGKTGYLQLKDVKEGK